MFVTFRRLVGVAVLVTALGWDAAGARAEVPALLGDTACRWGARACNPPVDDPVAQLRALRDHGDVLGFRMGDAPDVSMGAHWQGVQRLMPGRGRYLAVSRSGAHVSFVVVAMASRGGTGARYRSNRLAPHAAFQPPPAEDVVRAVAPDPDSRTDRAYNHSGGIQAIGSYLVVGFERPGRSRVAFWDVTKPTHPRRVRTLKHRTGTEGAGTVSIARLRNRRYLLVVGGTNANILDVYLSRRTTLVRPAFRHVATWNEEELRTELFTRDPFGIYRADTEFGDYQNLSLLSDRRGTLFMLGSHTTRRNGGGPDFAELFRLEGGGAAIRVTKVAKRHLYCAIPFGGRQCNFDAAGGAYVTPAGRLLLYGTEHDNDGPGGSVKLEEFRGLPHAASCRGIGRAWVELADDTGFDGDRSVMIDYRDRELRDYENYERVETFEDKASAAQWCLPRGWSYRLYENKGPCGGRHVDLVGAGLPLSDSRFGDGRGAVTDFNDAVSCSTWIQP